MYSWVRLSHLQAWSKGRFQLPLSSDIKVTEIATDSRTIPPGSVFVALRGENFDGHHYVADAIQKGAAAVITHTAVASPSVPVIVVDDPLEALARIASEMRAQFKGPVIAITGSAGKSTTKEMLATLLGPKTLASPASFNNLLGVSRTLCLLTDETEKVVLEVGMNNFGEIKEICERFQPHAGIITNIGDAHLGKLGGQEGVYRAKKELFDWLASLGKSTIGIALNLDDALVRRAYREAFPQGTSFLAYSAKGDADAMVGIDRWQVNPQSGDLTLELHINQNRKTVSVPLYGIHHTQNIAAAVAGAKLLGVSDEAIFERLKAIRPSSHRGELVKLAEGRILVDESYNSNPSALKSSLKTLSVLDISLPRVIVIGEMRELEQFSEKQHRDVGTYLAELFHGQKIVVVGVTGDAKALVEEVQKRMPGDHQFFANGDEAKAFVTRHFIPSSVCLIKGSRGVKLDRLVAAVQQDLA